MATSSIEDLWVDAHDISLTLGGNIANPILVRKRTTRAIKRHLEQENPTGIGGDIDLHILRYYLAIPQRFEPTPRQQVQVKGNRSTIINRPSQQVY